MKIEQLQELLNQLLGICFSRSSFEAEGRIMKEISFLELYYLLFMTCFKQSPKDFTNNFYNEYLLRPLKLTTESLYNCSLISLVNYYND